MSSPIADSVLAATHKLVQQAMTGQWQDVPRTVAERRVLLDKLSATAAPQDQEWLSALKQAMAESDAAVATMATAVNVSPPAATQAVTVAVSRGIPAAALSHGLPVSRGIPAAALSHGLPVTATGTEKSDGAAAVVDSMMDMLRGR